MSVLIKGLKMPKGCLGCPCINAKYNECMILQRRSTDVMTRMTDCPLIELPDHGDLIDESEKVDAQYYDEEFEEWSIKTKTVGDVLSEICEVPPKVIIPSERSEE